MKTMKYISFMKENGLNLGLLWLRILMGAGMVYHGYGKVFGGHIEGMIGFVGKLGFPFPALFAWMAALSEFLGGLLVVVGFKTRIASFFIAFTMFVAAFVAHASDPFQKKELALAYLAMAIALWLTGPGTYSWDAAQKKRG